MESGETSDEAEGSSISEEGDPDRTKSELREESKSHRSSIAFAA